MYRVMIVDDERLIREGLRGLIDWQAQGFDVVAVAVDGVDALEQLASTPVDLVVADIRMPRMDGLELLEALRRQGDSVRSRGHDVRFLILSGFAEFEYAQRASSLRIDGYLLKPVDEGELTKRLVEVRRQLDATGFSALTLVQGADRVPEAYAWGRWQVVLLALLTTSGQSLVLAPEADLALRQACRDQGWGEVFTQPPLVGLVLKQVYPGGRNLERLAKDLAATLGPWVPFFAAAAGDVVTEPSAVAASYRQAWNLLQQRFFSRPCSIAWPTAPQPPSSPADLETLAERLALALEAGQTAAVRAALVAAGLALSTSGTPASEDAAKEGFSRIVSGAVERYLGHEARSSNLRARTTAWIAEIWRQPFLATLVDFLVGHLETLMAKERGPDTAGLAQKMIDLIEARYSENLKLEVLAEVFHYNSAYLGKLFRSKTGEYFNTYLDRVRIRHSQDLLKQGLKVYQVAEMVGYKYVDYFHAKFKKYTGVSPSHYKGSDPTSVDGAPFLR